MAKEESAENASEKTEDLQEVKLRNPLLLIVLLLNIAVMGGIGFFQYQDFIREKNQLEVGDLVQSSKAGKDAMEEGADLMENKLGEKNRGESEGILFPLDGFTSNLAPGDGPRRFVRMSVVLKFSQDSHQEEFKARIPQIRDSIINILNSKRSSDLLKKEGKDYLKQEIKSSINSFLVDGKLIDMYYVGFQIN